MPKNPDLFTATDELAQILGPESSAAFMRHHHPNRRNLTTRLKYLAAKVLIYTGDECLIWPFGRDDKGYALIWMPDEQSNRNTCRVILQHTVGPPPTPKHESAHSCGHGHLGCVTPGHLSWKTPLENGADKLIHEQHAFGSRHGLAKLTEDQARQIREVAPYARYADIASLHGVGTSTIGRIVRGETWRRA